MSEPKITDLLPEHAIEVARLHISGISSGFISSLGLDFVKTLYEAMAQSDHSFGYVVKQNGKVVGFASFTTDLKQLYNSVMRKNRIKFAFLLAGRIFSLRILKKIFETLFYPKRIEKMNLPSAEFLSMVISEQCRGKGLATKLIKKGFSKLSQRGIDKIKILAAVTIGPINKLYEKLGFKVAHQIENHGVVSNVYIVDTNHFDKD